jgi:PhnB protein
MAKKIAKKKTATNKKAGAKSSRMTAKSPVKAKAAKKSASPAKKTAARRSAAKIDPLNRKQYTSMTPMLTVKDVRRAVDFYTRAFGFSVRGIMTSPDGTALHAELRLRDTTLMLSPESPEMHAFGARSIGGTPVTLYVLVEDVDRVFSNAVAAGGQVLMPVMDMFWGDRCFMVADPEGNKWMGATHKAEPTEAEMAAAMKAQMEAQQAGQAAAAGAGAESQY